MLRCHPPFIHAHARACMHAFGTCMHARIMAHSHVVGRYGHMQSKADIMMTAVLGVRRMHALFTKRYVCSILYSLNGSADKLWCDVFVMLNFISSNHFILHTYARWMQCNARQQQHAKALHIELILFLIFVIALYYYFLRSHFIRTSLHKVTLYSFGIFAYRCVIL